MANPTLTRFFALHYLLPFVVAALVVLHIFFLHLYGSSNPLLVSRGVSKVTFHPYYAIKDLYVYVVMLFILMVLTLAFGYVFMDAENFIPANSLVTPNHIQPEWYFLFAYAILRAIPNKLAGVLGLVAAVSGLFAFSINARSILFPGFNFDPLRRLMF